MSREKTRKITTDYMLELIECLIHSTQEEWDTNNKQRFRELLQEYADQQGGVARIQSMMQAELEDVNSLSKEITDRSKSSKSYYKGYIEALTNMLDCIEDIKPQADKEVFNPLNHEQTK